MASMLEQLQQDFCNVIDERVNAIKTCKLQYTTYYVESMNLQITIKDKNVFNVSRPSSNPYMFDDMEISNTTVSKVWAEKCAKLIEVKQKHDELSKDFANSLLEYNTLQKDISETLQEKTEGDILNDEYMKGYNALNSNKITEAMHHLLLCDVLLDDKTSHGLYSTTMYNIACCYAKNESYTKSLEYLSKSILSGYSDWEHLIVDPDFENLRVDCTELFVEIVKNLFNNSDKLIKATGLTKRKIEQFIAANHL